jgi:O-antigen/teichoic acid export membrane protein
MVEHAFKGLLGMALLRRASSAPAGLSMSRPFAGVVSLILANLFRAGFGVVTGALIYRALGPADIGLITTVLGAVGLLAVIGEFGMRNAAVHFIAQALRTGSSAGEDIGRTFLWSKTFLSTLASGAALFAAGLIASALNGGAAVESLIRLAAFSLLADGLLGYSLVILEAHQRFAPMSVLSGVQTLVRFALVAALFAVSQVNLTTLLVLESVVPLAAFCYSLRFLPRPYLALRRPRWQSLGPLLRFSKWLALAALSSLVLSRIDVLLLSHYHAPALVGVYAAAVTLVGKIDLIKVPILTAAFPDACRQVGKAELKDYVRRHVTLTMIVTVACLPLLLVGNWIIGALYGPVYVSATPVFAVLLVAYLLGLNVEPAAFVLFPLNKPAWVAGKELLSVLVLCTAGLLLIPPYGLVGAALCVLLRRVCEAALTLFLLWRHVWRAEQAAKELVPCT